MSSSLPAQRTAESFTDDDAAIIARALRILDARLRRGHAFGDRDSVKAYLRLQTQGLAHEVFGVMFLDTMHCLIAYEQLFRGTLAETSVHPREVLKRALALNAASVVIHHNHPSGSCYPSEGDRAVTCALQAALSLVEVAVLDHVITSDAEAVSMSELGMLPSGVRPGALRS